MRYIILALLVLLTILVTGCSTAIPVERKFPEVSELLLEECRDLQQLQDDAKLSDISRTINANYSMYYYCAVKNDSWIKWYKTNKAIFESVK